MNNKDIKLLEENGWIVECELPFEIRNIENGGFASGVAATIILDGIKKIYNKNSKLKPDGLYNTLYS